MLVHSSQWQPMIQNLELQQLCNRILENTINDPDKYQPGLTKIFFRAGMLAALESLRSERLNALVTVVQKNMRRKMAMKRYQELRRATIKIQTWWRGILARRFVEGVRRTVAATRLQTLVRRYVQRHRFLEIRNGIVLFQSRMCIFIAHQHCSYALHRCPRCAGAEIVQECTQRLRSRHSPKSSPRSVSIKSCFLILSDPTSCSMVRRSFRTDVKHVIYLQSCIRRRLARKELKALKAEARSVSKFKEISYRLENKVVELTQSLQKRTEEKKGLEVQLKQIEQQLQTMVSRHEEADLRAKTLQASVSAAEAEITKRDELLAKKA